jgi:hypothetical protein
VAGVEAQGGRGNAGGLHAGLEGVAGVQPDHGLVQPAAGGQGFDLVHQAVLGASRRGEGVDDVDHVHVAAAHASMASSAASWVATLVRPWTRPGTTATDARGPARSRMPACWKSS